MNRLLFAALGCIALVACDVPADPCVPIARDPAPRINPGGLSEADFASTVQNQLQDDVRRRLCQQQTIQNGTFILPPLGPNGLPDFTPPPPNACQLNRPDLVDLGPAPAFLPEVTGGLGDVDFPPPVQITAVAPQSSPGGPLCFDGVRVFNVEPFRLPILILNPNPPNQILIPSATVTAVDSRLAEGCRLKSLDEVTGEESVCLSATFVVWAYNESPESAKTMPGAGGTTMEFPRASRDFASTQAVLTITRPSLVALGMF